MHPNKGRFVVQSTDQVVTSSRRGQPVYLTTRPFHDGAGMFHREWAYDRKYAQVFKYRANAQRAATRWGGVVVQIEEEEPNNA